MDLHSADHLPDLAGEVDLAAEVEKGCGEGSLAEVEGDQVGRRRRADGAEVVDGAED